MGIILPRISRRIQEKCTPPATSATWLGFIVDTVEVSITLPADKLNDVLLDCRSWMGKSTASRRQTQSFSSTLQHLMKCIKPAARFTNRVLAVLRATPFKGQHVFDKSLLLDLCWFEKFRHAYNGVQLLSTDKRKGWVLQCDSTLLGWGAFSPDKYYGIVYDQVILDIEFGIAQLEALNLVLVLKMLMPNDPHKFCNIVNTDNAASQQVLEVGRDKDLVLCACACACACTRQIWLFSALLNFELHIQHKPGEDLVLADALSRRSVSLSLELKAKSLVNELGLVGVSPNFTLDILDFDL